MVRVCARVPNVLVTDFVVVSIDMTARDVWHAVCVMASTHAYVTVHTQHRRHMLARTAPHPHDCV